MADNKHTVLCVDDEQNILNSLKRLLRKEGYRFLTSSSGTEAIKLLEQNEVHVVISDQRMPEMSGTEFLAIVKEQYPDAIRIILTGYTELDSITQSINKGHVYKLLLKPWNDQNLKLEVKQALEQYDLVQVNKHLHERVLQQNEELRRINENLEELVQRRTKDLEIHNRALEFRNAVLNDLPALIVGVDPDGTMVLMNQAAQGLSSHGIETGGELADFFSSDVQEKVSTALASNEAQTLNGYELTGQVYDISFIPRSGTFKGQGVIMTLAPVED
jgi:CheY-like chemotaxis protein